MPLTIGKTIEIFARNNVRVFGHGAQHLLFAHGFGCDQTVWRFLTPAFEEDYRIVLFDYTGSGQSDRSAYDPGRYQTLEGYAQDVLDICSALNLEDPAESGVVFVGHSVSAMIGMLASLQAPEYFRDLIMIGPSPCYINEPGYTGGFDRANIEGLLALMQGDDAGWAGVLAPVVMNAPERPELIQELYRNFCALDPAVAYHFAAATFLSDYRKDLPRVKTPTLILQCSEDAIAPLPVGQYLRQHIHDSSLRILAAIGHCPHMSYPEETIQAIRGYLQDRSIRNRTRHLDLPF